MRKSLPPMIRFRNAVGLMLALSAIFAVVISAVTITQDRALGQTNPTVTLTVPDDGIVVEGSSIIVTVELSEAVASSASAVEIPLVVTGGTEVGKATEGSDFTLPAESVTFPADGSTTTQTYTITTVDTPDPDDASDTDYAEHQESFTVNFGDLSDSGYEAGGPVTIYINDGDNTAGIGTIIINVVDGGDLDVLLGDGDDNDETDAGFVPRVGHSLRVSHYAVFYDVDNDLNGDGELDGEVIDGVKDVLLDLSGQWIRTNDGSTTADDVDEVIEGETTSIYKLTNEDVGDTFTVQVWLSDQYDNGNGNANADCLDATEPDCAVSTAPIGENNNGQTLGRPASTSVVAYDLAKPFIIVGALDEDDERIEPGVVLTRNSSGMSSTSKDGEGDLIVYDENGDPVLEMVDLDGNDETLATVVALSSVTFTWHREGKAIEECDDDSGLRTGAVTDTYPCDGLTYTLTNDDIAKKITLVATYTTRDEVPGAVPAIPEEISDPIVSEPLGRVYSPNAATGMPEISGVAQVGSTLTADKGTIADLDNDDDPDLDPVAEADITYTWFHGDDDDYSDPLHNDDDKGTSYVLAPSDVGKTIKVLASFNDGLDDPEMRVSGLTTEVAGSAGEISRIEAAIRGVTVSADDIVTLSVDIYGLQNAKDNTIGATFEWTLTSGESEEDLEGSGREIDFTAPSSPGRYTVTASLGGGECQPETEADRADDCEASITVQVRRPSAPVADPVPPVNPPGEIPGLIPDADGNQYEVFTPVEGGTFDGGEGYSINVPSGAVPNGEYIGIRMSDDGAASNVGMTHQRYTLGGNMYGVHAVDASGAAISSYVLEDPAEVCVPLPASLRTNISGLSLAAINSDGSLTVLAAQVRLDEAGGTMVCGNLSSLPASVAVGAAGAPAAIPTATPVPEPELPPTGGTSPASGSLALWTLLLGIAVLTLGSALAISRRRESVRSR